MGRDNLVFESIGNEVHQTLETRKHLYKRIQKALGKPVICYFTSFDYPVMIEDRDADFIEGILRVSDLDKGLALICSSPGGLSLTAERIINICRAYSGTGTYDVIVPSKAKSAATVICFGAEKIIMSKTSELGPIDPQIVLDTSIGTRMSSLHNIVNSYERLFDEATTCQDINLPPYLQQLERYDSRDIEDFIQAIELSEDIAIKALKTGMMATLDETKIRENIEPFLSPKESKDHGRPILGVDAKKYGFNVEVVDNRDDGAWSDIYELYLRLNSFVSTGGRAKIIESDKHSFSATISERQSDEQSQRQRVF
ncbi:MAG: hypothetical protein KKE29_19850 [Proteobacteria bacterium]|nr:hypothetical protein [Pseudomonadota bacterium]MBV1715945.1 hypothetical protein [Desulfarculus sp.]